MATVEITLSDASALTARARAINDGFPSLDAYVARLIEADSAVAVSATLEAQLLDGLEGSGRRLSAADWDRRRLVLADEHRAGRR